MDLTTIDIRLKISQQEIIQAFAVHEKEIEADIQAAVKNAVKHYDYKQAMQEQVNRELDLLCIEVVKDYFWKQKSSMKKVIMETLV